MNIPKQDTPGVYCIENTRNGKKYIGSTIRLRSRIQSHEHSLMRGVHHSKDMQQDFDAGDPFVVSIIKEFPYRFGNADKNLLYFEREAIIAADSVAHGYNTSIPAGKRQPYVSMRR